MVPANLRQLITLGAAHMNVLAARLWGTGVPDVSTMLAKLLRPASYEAVGERQLQGNGHQHRG